MRYIVAVYELDRSYGGSEEGGWWYTSGELIRTIRVFRNYEKAYAFARRFNHWLKKLKPKYGVGSMLYRGGEYSAEVFENTAPKSYPEVTPHYE